MMGARSDLSGFDPDFAGPAEWARMYRAAGLQVVPAYQPGEPREDPAQWKRPIPKWRHFEEEPVPDATFERWYGPRGEHAGRPNMGTLTGRCSGNAFVIDLDTHSKPQANAWWQATLLVHNNGIEPETWSQRTGGGGRQLVFEAPPGWRAPTNKTRLGVDIRGQGGFAMLPPSRHLEGREYRWEPGAAPWERELAAAPEWLLEAVERLVEEHGGSDGSAPSERTQSPEADYDAFGNRVDGREEALRDLVWANVLDLRRRSAGVLSEDMAREAFDATLAAWLRNARTRLSGVDNAEGLEREGRGATAFRIKWQAAMRQWHDRVAKEAGERPFEESRATDEQPAPSIELESAFPIDPAAIPVRDWIAPGLLLRRYLTLLVAPPGSGKSLLTLQVAIMCAAGLSWGGWRTRAPCRVMVINAEDDLDEMRRRLWAAADLMGVPHCELAGRILLARTPESIVIARTEPKTKTVQRTALVEELVRTLKERCIDVVMADPFAETFEGDENSNSEAKWAGILWREIARRAETAVLLVHHTRKYANGMAGDADAARGASALVGTARIVATLFGMSEDEAGALNVSPQERSQFVRFDDAKANMSLITGVARWFRKRTLTVPNGGIFPGDEVGALEPWTPPGAFDGVSVTTLNTILDVIGRGLVDEDGRSTGAFFSPHKRAETRWVGHVIARHLGCAEERAAKILAEWLKSGVLVEITYHDAKQDRKGLKVDDAKRPGRAC